MVTPHGDSDFSKLVDLCPVKKNSLFSNPDHLNILLETVNYTMEILKEILRVNISKSKIYCWGTGSY